MFARFSQTKMGWNVAILILLCVIVFFHVWQLADIPRGLYVDESSIGLNAALIAQTGKDEHDAFLPVYFEAFGEYKNPIYIYSTALLFKILGVSELTLRLTSFIFFALFLTGLYLCVANIFQKNKIILFYCLLAAGFLPWFFPMSRIAFEVITQLPLTVFGLLFVYKTYHPTNIKDAILNAALAGLCIGLSVYSYSTARLLSYLFLIALFFIYAKRDYLKRHAVLLVTFLLTLAPYFLYSYSHPGALTGRFKFLSFITSNNLSFSEKIWQFLTNYLSYFDPRFLLTQGDPNLRHSIDNGGVLFMSVFVLALFGLIAFIKNREIRNNRFIILIIVSLCIAPIAAALTEPYHALRSILIGLYSIILSTIGLQSLFEKNLYRWIAIGLMLVLFIETTFYLHHYFVDYPTKSITAFESYDFSSTLRKALAQNPEQIIVSARDNQPYAHLEFYRHAYYLNYPLSIQVAEPIAAPNTCIIFFSFDTSIQDEDEYIIIDLSLEGNYTKLHCYSSLRL